MERWITYVDGKPSSIDVGNVYIIGELWAKSRSPDAFEQIEKYLYLLIIIIVIFYYFLWNLALDYTLTK